MFSQFWPWRSPFLAILLSSSYQPNVPNAHVARPVPGTSPFPHGIVVEDRATVADDCCCYLHSSKCIEDSVDSLWMHGFLLNIYHSTSQVQQQRKCSTANKFFRFQNSRVCHCAQHQSTSARFRKYPVSYVALISGVKSIIRDEKTQRVEFMGWDFQ